MARLVYDNVLGSTEEVRIDASNPVVTVGRSSDCTIRSNRKSVSRKHAEFRYLGSDGFEVIDLNSSNGIYIIINGERQKVQGREYLTDGDEVWCGDYILHFYDDAEDDFHLISSSPHSVTGTISSPQFAALQTGDTPSIVREKRELEQVISSQTLEIQTLTNELNRLRGSMSKHLRETSQTSAFQETLRLSGDEFKELQDELRVLRQENTKLRDSFQHYQKQAEASQWSRRELSKRIEDLENMLFDSQAKERELSQELKELRGLRNVLKELEEKQHSVEAENERLYQMLVDERSANATIHEGRLELENTLSEMKTMKTSLSQELSDAKEQIIEVEGKANNCRNRCQVLEARLKEVQSSLEEVTSERDRLEKELKVVQGELEEKVAALVEREKGGAEKGGVSLDSAILEGGAEAVETVRLVADAVVRTDLGPLSTIDRIRLQGAIRKMNEEKTLEVILELLRALRAEGSPS